MNQGFNLLSAIGTATNADTWSTIDINGDARPDLVCTGTRASNGYVTEFSPASNSYWKVYLQANTTGFAEFIDGPATILFPNPATELTIVQSDRPLGSITLLDLNGRAVVEKASARQAVIDLVVSGRRVWSGSKCCDKQFEVDGGVIVAAKGWDTERTKRPSHWMGLRLVLISFACRTPNIH
ncbi:MAG: hypothetical protein IPJ85_12525 [Flavobacteriales bacterium]|nr:hypothetical protein [Flavobacteriales bacterium]